jgi:hypothetical protein
MPLVALLSGLTLNAGVYVLRLSSARTEIPLVSLAKLDVHLSKNVRDSTVPFADELSIEIRCVEWYGFTKHVNVRHVGLIVGTIWIYRDLTNTTLQGDTVRKVLLKRLASGKTTPNRGQDIQPLVQVKLEQRAWKIFVNR